MTNFRISLVLICLCATGFVLGQTSLEEQLSAHVYFLSDDNLEGRGTGTRGEQLALNYISSYFAQYGLMPAGTKGYRQSFDFTLGKELAGKNLFSLNKVPLKIEAEYFPMPYSGNGTVKAKMVNVGFGIHAPGIRDDFAELENLEGAIFLINISSPDGIHPHSKYTEYTDYLTRIETAVAFGAAGVILYNEDENLDDPKFDLSRRVKAADIPIVFIQQGKNYLIRNKDVEVQLTTSLEKKSGKGNNVLGFIDNKALQTVVIGAHYDHLGYGENGGSLYRGEPAIHNGADDNASGVAAMMELAKALNQSEFKNNNYLFMAFSGEELGLFGSKSYTAEPTLPLENINYMINFDMVGRLDEERNIALNGVGTSPIFPETAKSITAGSLKINTTESGMGPSDHSSFYMKDIPVLHFYTGNNSDYHKPSDDPHLINYPGMVSVFDYTLALIGALDSEGELPFTKTKDSDTRNTPSFKVTLGVVPDYMYDGDGMKIDGVTDGKTANNAGILAGDIVVQMGPIKVTDMMSYMTALSKFEKGSSTMVTVIREGNPVEMKVTF